MSVFSSSEITTSKSCLVRNIQKVGFRLIRFLCFHELRGKVRLSFPACSLMFSPISIPLDLVQVGAMTTVLIHSFNVRYGQSAFPGVQYAIAGVNIALLFVLDWGMTNLGWGSILASWTYAQMSSYGQDLLSQVYLVTMLCLQFAALASCVRVYSLWGIDRFFVLRFLLLSCAVVYCLTDFWALASVYLFCCLMAVVADALGNQAIRIRASKQE